MESILFLSNDCLLRIVSWLDDPGSFHSFALTCSRFFEVSKGSSGLLHSNLIRAKTEYCIKRFIVDISDDTKKTRDLKYGKLTNLLRKGVQLREAKERLTYAKAIDLWKRNGPVAAEIFTWIRKQESSIEEDEQRDAYSPQLRRVTLYLPNLKKYMTIDVCYFYGFGFDFGPKLSIQVKCGDLDVKSHDFSACSSDWHTTKVLNAFQPMKAVIKLMQEELGPTIPPITHSFFLWLCLFYPKSGNLVEESRLCFKDAARNPQPSRNSVRSAIHRFHQDQRACNSTGFQEQVSNWKNDKDLKYCTIIGETVELLVQRSQTKLLKRLKRDASTFFGMACDNYLKSLPKQLLLELILRTSVESCNQNTASGDDSFVQSNVFFKCFEDKGIKAHGSIPCNAEYPSDDELTLEFTLPDGRMLKLEAETAANEQTVGIERLSPVTELLQEIINQGERSDNPSPKINNFFTTVYFLCALEFPEASETFLGRYDRAEGRASLMSI